jgi:hypothetical protein
MKRLHRFLIPFSAPLMTLAPLSLNAALDQKIVGAEAQWVVHLDLNAMRDTAIGKEIIAQAMSAQAKALQQKNLPVQIDIPKLISSIGSLTAYGTNLTQDPDRVDGTLIIQGTTELRAILESVVIQANIAEPEKVAQLSEMPFDAYSLDKQVLIAFPKEPMILVSKSKAQLLTAHKVFRGEAPSLAKAKKSPITQLVHSQTGSFVLASSVVPSAEFFPKDVPQARILQMAKSASVELGEANQRTFAHVKLQAASDDMADKLMKILQGLTAMASFAETDDKHLREFLQSVSVTREKNTVTLHLAYASERLLRMLEQMRQAQSRPRPPQRPKRPEPKIEGEVVGTWIADQQLGDESVAPEGFTTKVFENISLQPGSVVVMTGQRESGENARVDRIDLTPANGGPSLTFEAEYMNLRGYSEERAAAASGGRLIKAQSNIATARFQFSGAEGLYTITVRYVDESDGKSRFTLSLLNPYDAETSDAPSAPAAPAQPAQPNTPSPAGR